MSLSLELEWMDDSPTSTQGNEGRGERERERGEREREREREGGGGGGGGERYSQNFKRCTMSYYKTSTSLCNLAGLQLMDFNIRSLCMIIKFSLNFLGWPVSLAICRKI